MIKKYEINLLSDYISLIGDISKEEQGSVWFRGHSSAKYRLLPSVLRKMTPLEDARGHKISGKTILLSSGYSVTGISSERMLDDFKIKAVPFITVRPRNDFEWLFLMQHHGVPTRLLDWTTNALVALFFAVDPISDFHKSSRESAARFMKEEEFSDEGVAIYAINPCVINKEIGATDSPIDVANDYDTWSVYVRPMESDGKAFLPICILASHISPRIRSQSGTFTLHGANIAPLDSYQALRPLIRKIFIPYSIAIQIKTELYSLGVTPSFIYPDMDGIAREVKERELHRYALERKTEE